MNNSKKKILEKGAQFALSGWLSVYFFVVVVVKYKHNYRLEFFRAYTYSHARRAKRKMQNATIFRSLTDFHSFAVICKWADFVFGFYFFIINLSGKTIMLLNENHKWHIYFFIVVLHLCVVQTIKNKSVRVARLHRHTHTHTYKGLFWIWFNGATHFRIERLHCREMDDCISSSCAIVVNTKRNLIHSHLLRCVAMPLLLLLLLLLVPLPVVMQINFRRVLNLYAWKQ